MWGESFAHLIGLTRRRRRHVHELIQLHSKAERADKPEQF